LPVVGEILVTNISSMRFHISLILRLLVALATQAVDS